ncbi:SWIM zinc finger family protein [Delftia acidovorans]
MTRWMQAGRAVYDLDAGRYAWRELLREPLTAQQLQPANPEEDKALALVRGKAIAPPRIDRKDGFSRITGQIPRADGKRLFDTQLELDADERLTDARCSCNHYQQYRLRQGPCEHMIALRLVAQPQLDAARQPTGPQMKAAGQGEIA